MKCPRCHNRAMSLARWVPHALYQPLWKKKRYHYDCQNCSTELKPANGEMLRTFGISTLGAIGGLVLANRLDMQPQQFWMIMAGMGVGILAHYPLAKYTPASPETDPEVPMAKVE